jgi:2-polyprenyl-3-methyl-5-hydroxy-6-metoxy-1,4-benzoquinol methylase
MRARLFPYCSESSTRREMNADAATAAYYDRVAPSYDCHLDAIPVNRAIRETFCRRVAAATKPGDTILDFGAGTGVDADWYGGHGYRVVAYDVSSGMLEQLQRRCSRLIAEGTVVPVAGAWDALARQLQRTGPVRTVAANFAVLNHFPALGETLRRFAPYLESGGSVLASFLNPAHRNDMIAPWWWAAALRAPASGAITVRGAVTTHRFFPTTIRRAAAREFELTELLALEDTREGGALRPIQWRNLIRTQFWLAVWRKR